ncbi:hypothetical protein Dimus_037446, partial [Dionaea muscipula]
GSATLRWLCVGEGDGKQARCCPFLSRRDRVGRGWAPLVCVVVVDAGARPASSPRLGRWCSVVVGVAQRRDGWAVVVCCSSRGDEACNGSGSPSPRLGCRRSVRRLARWFDGCAGRRRRGRGRVTGMGVSGGRRCPGSSSASARRTTVVARGRRQGGDGGVPRGGEWFSPRAVSGQAMAWRLFCDDEDGSMEMMI